MKLLTILLIATIGFGGCASTTPLMDSEAVVEIEYENLPIHAGDAERPSGYESFVSRCRATLNTPAKNENITLDMKLSGDCETARLKTSADVSDPTHSQTVAENIDENRGEVVKDTTGKIVDGVLKGLVPVPGL